MQGVMEVGLGLSWARQDFKQLHTHRVSSCLLSAPHPLIILHPTSLEQTSNVLL
jgi:hypothetical protein